MKQYAVIVENDESQWNDVKGVGYHFPSRYLKFLQPGCRVVHYKGKLKKKEYSEYRLSDEPHYLGIAEIGDSLLNRSDSERKSYFCEVLKYQEFERPIPNRFNGNYLESIPENRVSNYWRDGVREISKETYDSILRLAKTKESQETLPSLSNEFESMDIVEGGRKSRYTTYYKRNPIYRQKALEVHGYSCMACGFNFEKTYGELGAVFIHVHHNKPVSLSAPKKLIPEFDLTVLYPNCHAMIHRRKNKTLTLLELREEIKKGYSWK